MLGPFTIDTYLPAFAGITRALDTTPVQMQQTLSAYLFGFALMNLFHGALADSFGRRPVVLCGVAVFTLASVGCALSHTVGQLVFFRAVQGLATGAGIVVSRAVIRDVYPPAQAQRVMSQVTIFFGVAPMVAPLVGGLLYVHMGWQAIFWFLAGLGALLWLANVWLLPETLPAGDVQPFNVRNLMRGYAQLLTHRDFLLLTLASGIPFNGMFLYVLAAPAFLGELLGFAPTEFYWFFCATVAGLMGGAAVSGRLAGRVSPRRQIRWGFTIRILNPAVDRLCSLSKRIVSTFCSFARICPMGGSATHGIAGTAGCLALLLVVARVRLASFSRLARQPTVPTLPCVQPPDLGWWAPRS